MKKMALISNLYPSESYPYKGTFVKNIKDKLEETYSIDVITVDDNKGKLLKYLSFYSKILQNLCFNHYDIIYVHFISHSILPVCLLKFLGKKFRVIAHVHGADVISEKRTSRLWARLKTVLAKIGFYYTNTVIFPSEYYKDLVSSKYNLKKHTLRISPSGGVELKKFRSYEIDKIYKFCFVGRIESDKGVFDFIESLAKFKSKGCSYKAVICGTGSESIRLKNEIDILGLNKDVTILEGMDQSKLVNLYNQSEFFIFPTKRISESLGLVGLEAMACGIPVVATNNYGPKTYIDHEMNGYLFDEENSEGLFIAMSQCINLDDGHYKEMSIRAKEKAKLYCSKKVSKNLFEIINKEGNNND
ncbi:glycosyltransferase family 4 protein [Vibrio cyclitrophicus]